MSLKQKKPSKEKKSIIASEIEIRSSTTAPLKNVKCNISKDIQISDNITIDCAKNGNLLDLNYAFDELDSPYKDKIQGMLNARDAGGKSALDWSAIFGTTGILAELIKRGSDINSIGIKGYTALHYAAAWNREECVEILLNLGADTQILTSNGEKAIDIARRYNNNASLWILQRHEMQKQFQEWLLEKQNELLNGEKSKAISKDDKIFLTNLFQEKLNSFQTANFLNLDDEKAEIQVYLDPFIKKNNEPAGKPIKK